MCEAFPKIAFVYHPEEKAVFDRGNFDMLRESLLKKKVTTDFLEWIDKSVAWEKYDCVILTSAINYVAYLPEFLNWLSEMEQLNIRVFNPPNTIRWNSNKKYLWELENKGICMPKTIRISKGTELIPDMETITDKLQSKKVVVKNLVDANGCSCWFFDAEKIIDTKKRADVVMRISHQASKCDVMLQEFCPEILDEGEWSLLYFNRQYSHSVLKLNRTGDFRIQKSYGGTFEVSTPSEAMLEFGAKVLSAVEGVLLYARVDIVRASESRFVLMELEVIDASLYVTSSLLADRYATAIRNVIDLVK